MNLNFKHANSRVLEAMLVLVTLVLTCVLYQTVGYKVIVLNLFYPPVILAAFFLGRYRAGVLAFFSVLAASVVLSFNLGESSPRTRRRWSSGSPSSFGAAYWDWRPCWSVRSAMNWPRG